MNSTQSLLRDEVQLLAQEAFNRNLISGYGDGADDREFQIVLQGKPKHFTLEDARSLLVELIFSNKNEG